MATTKWIKKIHELNKENAQLLRKLNEKELELIDTKRDLEEARGQLGPGALPTDVTEIMGLIGECLEAEEAC